MSCSCKSHQNERKQKEEKVSTPAASVGMWSMSSAGIKCVNLQRGGSTIAPPPSGQPPNLLPQQDRHVFSTRSLKGRGKWMGRHFGATGGKHNLELVALSL